MRLSILQTVILTLPLLLSSVAGFAHGDKNHKGKVTKVTPMEMMQAMADSSAGHHEDMAGSMQGHSAQAAEAAIEKDIEQIITDTQRSATATVIKVASLTLVLLGLVVAYYPRKRSISSGNKERGAASGR